MATNLNIDDKLLMEAVRVGKLKTKRATVNQALLEYVQRHKQQEILKSFGSIDFAPDYNYKQQRKVR
jgi:Arc/MetJ family transcription regulator